MEISGRVYKVMPVQSGMGKTGNEWRKIDFVVETDAKYDNKICFTAWSDRVSDVENLTIGQKVKVSFDVASREYNERWYTDIKAWKIDVESEGGQTAYASSSAPQSNPAPAPQAAAQDSVEDDLPF
jgi:hypothetical protein